jgi:hypothetical protein
MEFGLLGRGSAREGLPLGQGGRASFLECLSVDEVAFQAEVIVDACMD